MAKLNAISRSNLDNKLYLQHAGDLPLTPDNADKVIDLRHELTAKRAATVRQYLATKPGTPEYEISVHNGPTPAIYAPFALSAFRGQVTGYVGSLQGAAGQLVGGSSSGNNGAASAAGAGGGTAPTPGGPPGGSSPGTPGGSGSPGMP